jgi:hypothetical protein
MQLIEDVHVMVVFIDGFDLESFGEDTEFFGPEAHSLQITAFFEEVAFPGDHLLIGFL